MDQIKLEEQNEELVIKDLKSKFYLCSLDIDITFYGTKLEKLKKIEC